VNEDSYGVAFGAAWKEHLYSYAGNNPIIFGDPTGHKYKLQQLVDAQANLLHLGILPESHGIDYTFDMDSDVKKAVKTFQKKDGLKVTGKLDNNTFTRILDVGSGAGYTLPRPTNLDKNNFKKTTINNNRNSRTGTPTNNTTNYDLIDIAGTGLNIVKGTFKYLPPKTIGEYASKVALALGWVQIGSDIKKEFSKKQSTTTATKKVIAHSLIDVGTDALLAASSTVHATAIVRKNKFAYVSPRSPLPPRIPWFPVFLVLIFFTG
jgi:hypothetical protein